MPPISSAALAPRHTDKDRHADIDEEQLLMKNSVPRRGSRSSHVLPSHTWTGHLSLAHRSCFGDRPITEDRTRLAYSISVGRARSAGDNRDRNAASRLSRRGPNRFPILAGLTGRRL